MTEACNNNEYRTPIATPRPNSRHAEAGGDHGLPDTRVVH